MTSELKAALDKIAGLIRKQNLNKFANEQVFLDELKPEISKANEALENPKKEQTTIIPDKDKEPGSGE